MDENKLVLGNGATPMTVAELVVRECDDEEWLNDVIYYIKAFVERTYYIKTTQSRGDEKNECL